MVAVRYVENNPVREGMVKRAWEYLWSSVKFHTGEQQADILVKDRDLLGFVGNWEEFLQGDDIGEEGDLGRTTKTGRLLVGNEHLVRIEKQTGRNLRKGKLGRKPLDSMK